MLAHDKIEQRRSTDYHTAEIDITAGKNVAFKAKAQITTSGLLAMAFLVSGILLSTSVVILAASRAHKSAR